MLALRKPRAEPGVCLEDVAPPQVQHPHELLLSVQAAGICGTDLHIDEWTPAYTFMASGLPVTLGHEFSARVLQAAADGQGPQPGQLVVVRPSVTCGVCPACRAGQEDDCTGRSGIGVRRNGGFASQVVAPRQNCLVVPDGVPAAVAALAEPLSVGAEAVRQAALLPAQTVLVLGPGNIGQAAALFAREAGARVVVAGRDDAPRLAVLAAMGFDEQVDSAGHATLADALAAHGLPTRFDAVIEASGAQPALEQGLALLRRGGVLSLCGIHSRPVPLDLAALVRHNHQIRGSYRAPVPLWPEVLAFMARHAATLAHMVTHQLPLEQAETGFALSRQRLASKVVLLPNGLPEAA